MPRSVSQILYGQRTRRRFRSSGMDNDAPMVAPVDPVLLAKAAVEEVAGALTGAGIPNIGTIDSSARGKVRGIRFEYKCPAVNCAQHRAEGAKCEGSGVRVDWQLAPSSTPCPVLAVLRRLVNAGVLEKVKGTAGASAWALDHQPCKHTRSKLRVEFVNMKAESRK